MAKSKFVIASFRCPTCSTPSKTTRHGKTPLTPMSRYCKKCRTHTEQKPKDVKKPSKK